MKINADYHTHTCYSHGSGTVEENVQWAIRRGLNTIGIADHGPANPFGIGVRNADTLLKIRDEVRQLSNRYPNIHVLCGVEANITNTDGELDVPENILRQLDYVLVGLHLMVGGITSWRLTGLHVMASLTRYARERAIAASTKAVVNAVKRNNVFAVTHPGLRLPVAIDEVARICVERGVLLEINAKHYNMSLASIQTAAQEGARFILGSDAHCPQDVGRVDKVIELVELADLSPSRILNVSVS